jgi:hypothetical protein
MSDLSNIEKRKLEQFLNMGNGYVLNFSNRTFAEFVLDSTGKDVYDAKYDNISASGSKANRLRSFWKLEQNHVVGKLLDDLLEFQKDFGHSEDDKLFQDCARIVQRLKQGGSVPEIEVISPNADGKDFEVLAKSVREAIDKNEPEAGLDRLHAFVVKYIRVLCEKRNISTGREKPLHGLFGEYVKHLRDDGLVESEMTERILKSSISTMEAFNSVRNNRSLAHDNPVLNYNESLLIFNHVTSAIRFIKGLESKDVSSDKEPDVINWEE